MPFDLERTDEEPIIINFDNNGNISEIKGQYKARDRKKHFERLKGVFNNGEWKRDRRFKKEIYGTRGKSS